MNNKRRKKLRDVEILLRKTTEMLMVICDEEQDALDNMPENLQDGERYQKIEDTIEHIEETIELIDNAMDHIDEAIN